MQKSMKCPKCGSKMEKGVSLGSVMGHPVGGTTIVKKGDFVGDKIIPFYCKNCGYIELFIEKFLTSP
jgi:predicted nucleic-acid-binding Zn-ribbon protein